MELTWSSPRGPCQLQREPSVGKLWNLLGRLHEIHVAAKRDTCSQLIELTQSPPRDPWCCKESHLQADYGTYLVASTRYILLQKHLKGSHLQPNSGTYFVASTRNILLQREPSIGKLWNLLGRLHEIHVAQSFGHLVFPALRNGRCCITKNSGERSTKNKEDDCKKARAFKPHN